MELRLLHFILTSCILIIGTFTSIAQNSNYVSASYTPGFLLAHRADIKNLAAHNYGFEVAYELDRTNTSWGSHYQKPSVGYGFLYYNLGKEETGHAFGGQAHVKLNVLKLGSSDLRFRAGAGLAYLTQKFDVETNRRNQAIGSHLNGSMQFGLIAHIPVRSNKDYIECGISISHYSNAAFKVPNLGYNIPSFTLRYGLGVKANSSSKVGMVQEEDETKKYDWRVTAIYGKKQRNFANPLNFYNKGIQFRGLRNVSATKAWRFGLDYTLDKSYKYAEDFTFPLSDVTIADQSEVAIAGGFQWSFGKVGVAAEIGAYLYKPGVLKNPLNQRMGLIYTVDKHWSAQGMLRFHRGVADFFEMGIGYTL
jgi:hypothetical protein